jgi:hypothetical protein
LGTIFPEKARCIVLDLLEFGCKVDVKYKIGGSGVEEEKGISF